MRKALFFCLVLTVLGCKCFGFNVAWPQEESPQIAYVSPDGAIWTVDVDGKGATQLAPAEGYGCPVWSPDGQWLAVVKNCDPWGYDNEIYLVEATGENLHKVADGYLPLWSSDGKYLLCVTNISTEEETPGQEVRKLDIADETSTALGAHRWGIANWPVEEIRFSPGEEWISIYMSGLEAEGFLGFVRADGSEIWEPGDLVYYQDNYDWAPQGLRLVYRDSGNPFMGDEGPSLKIVDVDTKSTVATLPGDLFWPRWSPQGDSILFFKLEREGFRVMTANADGTDLRSLSDSVFANIWGVAPSWSRSGESFLFISGVEPEGDTARVRVMDADGGELHSVAEALRPVARWSPSGKSIAVVTYEVEAGEIYVVNTDGSDFHKLADGTSPAWKP